jgi:hypothetical protein
MKIQVKGAQRNMSFGHSGSWASGNITRDLHHQHADKVITPNHPNTRKSDGEKRFIVTRDFWVSGNKSA